MTRFKAAARGYIGGEPSIHGLAAVANRYTAKILAGLRGDRVGIRNYGTYVVSCPGK